MKWQKVKCTAPHTPCPSEKNEWMKWSNEMLLTHKQIQCPSCLMYSIWVKKIECEYIRNKLRMIVREKSKDKIKEILKNKQHETLQRFNNR